MLVDDEVMKVFGDPGPPCGVGAKAKAYAWKMRSIRIWNDDSAAWNQSGLWFFFTFKCVCVVTILICHNVYLMSQSIVENRATLGYLNKLLGKKDMRVHIYL